MRSNSLTEPHEAIGLGAEFVAIWDQHLAAEEMQTAFDAMMEYLATGRRILEAPAAACDAKPCSTVSSVTSTTTTTAEGSTDLYHHHHHDFLSRESGLSGRGLAAYHQCLLRRMATHFGRS